MIIDSIIKETHNIAVYYVSFFYIV